MGIDWEFHFRNFYDHDMHVRVHHAGCAITPWYDGRPGCWKNRKLRYSPTGYGDAVYCPSNWVVNFGEWWPLIMDGLKLIADLGLFIIEPNPESLIEVCADVWAVSEDVVQVCVDDLSDEELQELLAKADQSLGHSCDSIGISVEEVTRLANAMHLSDKWAFIAGSAYKDYIHDNDSPIVGKHGWSVFREHDVSFADDDRRIARAAFIYKGHLIYAVDEANKTKLWSSHW